MKIRKLRNWQTTKKINQEIIYTNLIRNIQRQLTFARASMCMYIISTFQYITIFIHRIEIFSCNENKDVDA